MYMCSSCTELAEENRFMCMTLPWSFKAGEHSVIWFPTDGVSIHRGHPKAMQLLYVSSHCSCLSHHNVWIWIQTDNWYASQISPEIKRCCPILWAFTNTVLASTVPSRIHEGRVRTSLLLQCEHLQLSRYFSWIWVTSGFFSESGYFIKGDKCRSYDRR